MQLGWSRVQSGLFAQTSQSRETSVLLNRSGRIRGHGISRCRTVKAQASIPEPLLVDDEPRSKLKLERLTASYDDSTLKPSNGVTRHVFTVERWGAHRSTGRYWRHLRGIFSSATFKNLLPPIAYLTAASAVLCTYQELVQAHELPAWCPLLHLSDLPFESTNFALSLLLVFRTDASYARWVEALDVWSTVRNTSKKFIRDSACWVRDQALQALLMKWTIAFCKSLEVFVTTQSSTNLRQALAEVLTEREAQHVVAARCAPHYCLHVLTEIVNRAAISELREEKMLEGISTLNSAVGASEKLMRYPIPLSYTRHTSRFMLLWLGFLPGAMWDDLHWLCVPVTAVMAFLLLGIEEIGVQIEEPFTRLPLQDFTDDIRADISQIYGSMDDVHDLVTASLIQQDRTATIQPSLGAGSQTMPLPISAAGASNSYGIYDDATESCCSGSGSGKAASP